MEVNILNVDGEKKCYWNFIGRVVWFTHKYSVIRVAMICWMWQPDILMFCHTGWAESPWTKSNGIYSLEKL